MHISLQHKNPHSTLGDTKICCTCQFKGHELCTLPRLTCRLKGHRPCKFHMLAKGHSLTLPAVSHAGLKIIKFGSQIMQVSYDWFKKLCIVQQRHLANAQA